MDNFNDKNKSNKVVKIIVNVALSVIAALTIFIVINVL